MPTAQQEYHGKVAQVKAKVTAERTKMGAAKSEAKELGGRIGDVQSKWAEFVTALGGARAKHNDYVTSLGSTAAHHKEKVTPAQTNVVTAQSETETSYRSLIADIRHPAIQKFAALLGALEKSVEEETGVVARLGANFETMNGEAGARANALEQLHGAAVGYKEKRLDPQQGIIEAVPGHYDAQMGGTNQAIEALDAYVAST
jgi:phage-related protein